MDKQIRTEISEVTYSHTYRCQLGFYLWSTSTWNLEIHNEKDF